LEVKQSSNKIEKVNKKEEDGLREANKVKTSKLENDIVAENEDEVMTFGNNPTPFKV